MFISRTSARPSAPTINVLVELLPQSIAATTSPTDVLHDETRHVEGARHDFAHRIVRAYEEVREMRVQTLDANARASDTTYGLDEVGAYGRRTPSTGVLVVRALKVVRVHEQLEAVHPAVTFDATDRVMQFRVDQPVERGHGGAVAQVRFVLDDDGTSVNATNDHSESAGEGASE
jgi:hypothetical protein